MTASTTSASAQAIQSHFARHFGADATVVSFEHQGEFGAEVRVATMLDGGVDASNLHFYVFGRNANSFRPLEPGFVMVDGRGFLHFSTSVGGDIVITNTRLH